jgi:hypothetical protein
VFINGYDLSGILASTGMDISADVAEVTVYPSAAKEYLPGLLDGSMSFAGFVDTDPDGAGALLSLADRVSTWNGLPVHALVYPGGSLAVGGVGKAAQGLLTANNQEAPVDNAVTLDVEIQANGGVRPVVTLADLAARTTTGNGSAVDSAIAGGTTFGLEAFLQVTAGAGSASPTLAVKVQGSADGSTGWTDLVTFSTVALASVPTAQKGSWAPGGAGSTPRYLRATWTITGTTPSFTFAVAAWRRLVAP